MSTTLLSICEKFEDAGGPPEFSAQIKHLGPETFAGVSALDLTTITSGELTTLRAGVVAGGAPAEALAMLDKIKAILT